MKSPNSKLSLKNLSLAAQLINNSWNDLKNDAAIREKNIHTELGKTEDAIMGLIQDLRDLGYGEEK